ncbi:hypothetical protein VV02_14405 [Luteipulveratus mongoliensis]|uniref:Uncharacterized protein n=1 Tax=Luteipulveratus mongoliensis TaxID=571913 RepID=A0A0K1JJM6_9MICO|nr:hypothetical protein VV02_14405 [Luteipulveratus mongoliensis]
MPQEDAVRHVAEPVGRRMTTDRSADARLRCGSKGGSEQEAREDGVQQLLGHGVPDARGAQITWSGQR